MRGSRGRLGLALLAAALALSASNADAWGFLGHRIINARAVDTLPPELQALFSPNRDYLAEHSVDPDLWRHAGREGEFPNHFLDSDAFGEIATISRDERAHLAQHGAEAREQGRVPWRIAEEYASLVNSFRAHDSRGALRHAAVLGHYVADAHVPLHGVLNYDGQLTDQKGIHSRWESQLVRRYREQIESSLAPAAATFLSDPPESSPAPAAATRLTDPIETAFAVMGESRAAVPALLESDLASIESADDPDTREDERYDDAYYERLFGRERDRLVGRMSTAVTRLGSLWLSAWEAAERPVMPPFEHRYVRGQRRAILVSIDAAGAVIVGDAVARGVMPNLRALRNRGTRGSSLTSFPAKTAPGHAALFTGTWGDKSGITANSMARPGDPINAERRGFLSTELVAEPIWVTAVRQGLSVTAAFAPQLSPFEPFLEEGRFGADFGFRLTLIDGYPDVSGPAPNGEMVTEDSAVWAGEEGERHFSFDVGGHRFVAVLEQDPEDAAVGFDTLRLSAEAGGEPVRLKPNPPAAADPSSFRQLTVDGQHGPEVVHFRLFELSTGGERLRLFHTAPQRLRSNRRGLALEAQEAIHGFLGNGISGAYGSGDLGPRLSEGGDGDAEERYLESLAYLVDHFSNAVRFLYERGEPDLLVTYLPLPDEASHTWLGYLDDSLPGYDRDLALQVQPYLDRALGLVDRHVGVLVELAGPDGIVAVTADHGQVGANRRFAPNVVLREVGLLVADADGEVDLAQTKVYYRGQGMLVLNRSSREGGIVAAHEEEELLQLATDALRGFRDTEHGGDVVLEVIDPRRGTREPALGGPNGADLYLALARGYDDTTAIDVPAVARIEPKGMHLFGPQWPEMRAVFIMAGPGVSGGADLGEMRQIDVVPTLCAILGIDPPRQAIGTVLERALTWPDSR